MGYNVMGYFSILWLASLGLLVFAFLKLNKLRWLIGIGCIVSFIALMIAINVDHDDEVPMKSWVVDRQQRSEKVVINTTPLEVYAMASEVPERHFEALHEHTYKTATISAVGDIMVHRSQLIRAYDGTGFDFTPSFRWVTPYITKADYAIGNLETTFASAGGQRRLGVDKFFQGYSGFPVFNTPDIMAQNLKNAGFDLLLTANNHALDSKVSGLTRTLDILDNQGVDHIGTYRTAEEAEAFFIKEINGITFGIINYTYAMNGFWLNEGEAYKVNHLGNYDEPYILEMYESVSALADENVDFVVVALHYGTEYLNEPDRYVQQPLIDGLFEHGADIILGGHPHVLQPFEVRDLVRENGEIETGVVIYSLGNFISSQRHRYTNKDTDFGMIFELDFEKVDDQKATIEALRYVPTYVYWSETDLEIIPMMDIPEAINLTEEDRQRIVYGKEKVIPLINSYYGLGYSLNGAYLEFDLE